MLNDRQKPEFAIKIHRFSFDFSFGALLTFISDHSKWATYFPGIRSKTATLAMNLLFPVVRELSLSMGKYLFLHLVLF